MKIAAIGFYLLFGFFYLGLFPSVSFFSPTPLFAATNEAAGFDFVNLPVSARTAGGAVSLISEKDANLSFRTNPAMLAGINKTAVSIDFAPVIEGVYSGAVSGAIMLKNGFVLAPSVSYISFGSIDTRDENGDELHANVSPFSVCFDAALARRFYDRLNVGVRLKFMHEQLTQKTSLWDENYSGGVAADVGIYSKVRFFRYSAGFRNVGFAYDSYEDLEIKTPLSSFVAIGVTLENEMRLNWYFECEKFLYDYMFFRTGFEIPLQRDVLILRTGTAFSPDDVRYAFRTFAGSTMRSWEYSSQIWLLAAVGATINARIAKNILSLDIACQFRKDGLKPGFSFSGTMYF